MTRFGVPTLLLLLMIGLYLLQSGAPLRVQLLSVACLVGAFWLPAVVAADLKGLRRCAVPCIGLVVAGMLMWDALSGLVIAKVEPFEILRSTPWAYVLGLLCIGIAVLVSAALNSAIMRRASSPHKAANAR